jgi:pimeloyl-ACP methyl ester carboxylesterase
MKDLRIYGGRPFTVAVIHGGPGAPGEMAPVARELATISSVLEPLQKALTIEGQVSELKAILVAYGTLPITLIGFSWGSLLSYIFTAQNPALVKKLILVSSGVYQDKYAENITSTRLMRLADAERERVLSLMNVLDNPSIKDKNTPFARLGGLIFKADSYSPLPHDNEVLEYQHDIYENVWGQAVALRKSGELLKMGQKINCPVLAIHGDYDPHPFSGVSDPLSRTLTDFRFILLPKCGHYPWLERDAKARFYRILKKEIAAS